MVVKKKPKPLLVLLILFIILVGVGCFSWFYLTGPVDKNNSSEIVVEIPSGTSTNGIASILKDKGLIKSELFFKVYIKINNYGSLKASTYSLNKSMNLDEIIKVIVDGNNYNPDTVKLTFKEGKRITDYAKLIADNTNNSYDDVIATFKDREYAKTLIAKYWFLSDNILDPNIYYPLEGYLAPDTYFFDNKDVSLDTIIETLLDEMDKKLTPYKSSLGNNVHEFITMASIVELEGTNSENRKMIVGVFNNRLKSGMNLGSDVTTYYGLQADMKNDLSSKDFQSINAYNTRLSTMAGKLPIGPICSVDKSSIEASINPADNDYLFFVADKHGKIYYTKTMKEHEEKIAEIKKNGDWIF